MKKFFRAVVIIVSIPVVGLILMVVLGTLLDNSETSKENDRLKTEIQKLNAEIERLNNEPEILFSKAYEEKNRNRYEHALYLLQTIRGKYPDYKHDEITATINDYASAKLKYEAEQEEQNRIAELERQKRIAEREEQRRLAEQEAQERAEQERLEQERIAREKEIAYLDAIQNLVKTRDEVEGINWYKDPSIPKYLEPSIIYPYIGEDDNKDVWLRFKMKYCGSKWLFVQKVSFKIDDEKYELNYGFFSDWNRDNGSDTVWEWKDEQVDKRTWEILNKIASSQKTTMRYHGQQYYIDREVSTTEKMAIDNILIAYRGMGGLPPQ